MRYRISVLPTLLSVAYAIVAAVQLGAQTASREAFVTTLGRDTTSVEQFSRSGNTITGDYVGRQGGTVVYHYVLVLRNDGMPAQIDVTPRKPDGSTPSKLPRSIAVTYSSDTAAFTTVTGDSVTRQRIAVKNAFPVLGNSMAMYDVALAHLRASRVDSGPVQTLFLAVTQVPQPLQVKFVGRDSARVWTFGFPQYLRVAPDGRVLGLSGRATTIKVETRQVASLEIGSMASAFAAEDAAGKGLNAVASVRDTVNATIGNAHIWLDYSRPLARGRAVFRNGVLGDTLWRTGANAATQFKTDADLVIAGKTIPAGMYTLWTSVPSNNGSYDLVFNKQVGQWGTEHDPMKDLVRVPLTVTPLSAPVDEFTIAFDPTATGGTINLRWGSTQLSTQFAAK